MSHLCGSTCRRKQDPPDRCDTCRRNPKHHSPNHKDRKPHATPQQVGAAVDMYFDGLSYRTVAENIDDHFDRKTNPSTVYRWVQEQTKRANDIVGDQKVSTGNEWVADEMEVKVGGERYWLFNVMDAKTRFILAAYLSPERTTRAAAIVMGMARRRSENLPETVKTDGLASYKGGLWRAFRTAHVKHVVSKGIRAEINNNLSERLQGTFRDRDKTLRGLKKQETGQTYIDGLVLHYNYFRPHQSLDGKRPAESAGAVIPFESWRDVAGMQETTE